MNQMTMTPGRWELVMAWFDRVVTTGGAARRALLEEAERTDPDLRRELEALLDADGAAGEFLEQPAPIRLAQQTTAITPSLKGQRIGPYQLKQEIGQGGMGVVYLAERADGAYQQTVALKLVRNGFETEETHRRFRIERQILARLEHPHIARLLDGGTTEEGRPWLAMEYIEGEPITTYCAQHHLSIEARLRLFQAVCSAVQYSHQHFIIHRDLKPGNLLVTKDGVPKLLDFGIARLLEADPLVPSDSPTTKQRLMTPDYASPEQLCGEPINVTSDVYSLGVVLYELLTGVRPTPSTSRAAALQAEKPSLVVHRSQASTSRILRGDLDNILLKALRPEPQHRYASVEQLSEDIQRYLAHLPVLARRGSFAYRASKQFKRQRAALTTAVLVFLSLCAGLILTTWQARVAQAAQHQAEAERNNAEVQRQRAEAALQEANDQRQRAEEALARVQEERRKAESQRRLAEQAKAQALTQQRRAEQEQQHAAAALATAQQERARAERGFQDVRKLANAMLFEVHDEIAELAGATKARAVLVKLAQEYLGRVVTEAQGDQALQQELARAYMKLGDAQGNSRAGELGDKPAALNSYRQALQIRQNLLSASGESLLSRHELALNHSKLAQALEALEQRKEAIAEARQALRLLSELRAANPNDGPIFHDGISQYHLLCDLLRKAGENADALALTHQSIALLESHLQTAETRESGEVLYNDYQRFALMLRETSQEERALSYYQRALDLARTTAAQRTNNFNASYVQSDIYRGMALTLTRRKDFRRALGNYQQGHEIIASLAQLDPANIRLLDRLSTSHVNIAEVFLQLGDTGNALTHYRRAVELEERLHTQIPSRLPLLLADRLKVLADLLRAQGAYQEARAQYERAMRLVEPLVAQNPQNILARRRLGIYLVHIGTCQLKLGETGATQETLQAMLRLREELYQEDPENPSLQSDLAYGYCALGDWHAHLATTVAADSLTHWRAALAFYQRGLPLFLVLRDRGQLIGGTAAKPTGVIQDIAKCEAAIARLSRN